MNIQPAQLLHTTPPAPYSSGSQTSPSGTTNTILSLTLHPYTSSSSHLKPLSLFPTKKMECEEISFIITLFLIASHVPSRPWHVKSTTSALTQTFHPHHLAPIFTKINNTRFALQTSIAPSKRQFEPSTSPVTTQHKSAATPSAPAEPWPSNWLM